MLWHKTVKAVDWMNDTKALYWIPHNTIYAVMVGSHAYGLNRPDSDYDIYGVTIPPVEYVYPEKSGRVPGFGNPLEFEQYMKQHFMVDDKEVDLVVYNIVKYFRLCADCNPNMIDSLFVPENCILHITDAGRIIRDNRHLFLSKMAKKKFMGYAFSQMAKIRKKTTPQGEYRKRLVELYGYDTKFAMHLVRLVEECKQILAEGDIDLQESREKIKAVRDGRYSLEALEDWFHRQEEMVEEFYMRSSLPKKAPMNVLEGILRSILNTEYERG